MIATGASPSPSYTLRLLALADPVAEGPHRPLGRERAERERVEAVEDQGVALVRDLRVPDEVALHHAADAVVELGLREPDRDFQFVERDPLEPPHEPFDRG